MTNCTFFVREIVSYSPRFRVRIRKIQISGASFAECYSEMLRRGHEINCAWPDWPQEQEKRS